MPFVLPLTDQEAENARLLDRLTKQQEINQSLREDLAMKDRIIDRLREEKYQLSIKHDAENAELKAELEQKDADWNDWLNKAFGDDLYPISPSPEPDDFVAKVQSLRAQVERLKAESIRSVEENRKTILEAKFDTWREVMGKYDSDYNMEDEAVWLIDEAGSHISDAIVIFNDLYEESGIGDEYIWQLKCDHERKWEVYQVYMDDEGDYTLTEEEWEAQNQEDNDPEEYGEYTWKQGLTAEEIAKGDTINPETGEALTCDFCDKERKVLTKRDAGYDEWTCSTCHKEQYPEQYEEEQ